MLEVAEVLRAASVRICLGGQSISLQGLLGKWRSKKPHPHSDSSTKVSSYNIVKTLMQHRRIMYLAHLVRQNLPYNDTHLEKKVANTVDSLRQVMPMAEEKGLQVHIENHWGISTRPQVILLPFTTNKTCVLRWTTNINNTVYHLERIDQNLLLGIILLVQLLIGLSPKLAFRDLVQPLLCHRQSIAFPPLRRLNGVTMLLRVCRNEK